MNENPYIKALECFREQRRSLSPRMEMDYLLNRIREKPQDSIPEFLSHYCSADVAIKIFENLTIWLTDIRRMNDSSELIYAIKLIKSEAYKLNIKNPIYEEFSNIVLWDIDALLGLPERLQEFEVGSVRNKMIMATCFSVHHDDANMWRLYGDQASGVEVRFNSKALAETAGHYGQFIPNSSGYETGFVRICYSGDGCNCLENLGGQIIESYRYAKSEEERSILRTLIYYSVSDFLMSHKHPSFQGEGEYRLFTHIPIEKTWGGSDFLLFHPNGKTQYTPLALGAYMIGYHKQEDFLSVLIESICFGPHIHKEKLEKLEKIFFNIGLSKKLTKSTAPIRKF